MFDPESRHAAASHDDAMHACVTVWDVAKRAPVRTFAVAEGDVVARFARDGRALTLLHRMKGGDGLPRFDRTDVYDWMTGAHLGSGRPAAAGSDAPRSSGAVAALVAGDAGTALGDDGLDACVRENAHLGPVHPSPDGALALTAYRERVAVYDTGTCKRLWRLREVPRVLGKPIFLDDERLATGKVVWDLAGARVEPSRPGPSVRARPSSVQRLPAGGVAVVTPDGTRREIPVKGLSRNDLFATLLSADDKLVAVATPSALEIWSVETRRLLWRAGMKVPFAGLLGRGRWLLAIDG